MTSTEKTLARIEQNILLLQTGFKNLEENVFNDIEALKKQPLICEADFKKDIQGAFYKAGVFVIGAVFTLIIQWENIKGFLNGK